MGGGFKRGMGNGRDAIEMTWSAETNLRDVLFCWGIWALGPPFSLFLLPFAASAQLRANKIHENSCEILEGSMWEVKESPCGVHSACGIINARYAGSVAFFMASDCRGSQCRCGECGVGTSPKWAR